LVQATECLLCMHKALSSNPIHTKKKKQKTKHVSVDCLLFISILS
jgi:hypothetical protein